MTESEVTAAAIESNDMEAAPANNTRDLTLCASESSGFTERDIAYYLLVELLA